MTSCIVDLKGPWNGDHFTKPPIGILLHSFSEYIYWKGEWVWAPDWLKNKRGLSAHCSVSPNGTRNRMQTWDHQAWHAGVSSFQGIYNGLNATFLSIEIMLAGRHLYDDFKVNIHKPGAFTEEQHYATALECAAMMAKIPSIKPENIRGHSDVSGRQFRENYKVDPGQGWQWYLFYKFLQEIT